MVSASERDFELICFKKDKLTLCGSEENTSDKVLIFFRESKSLTFYWFLAALRILITFIPQRGYIHPDEFCQTTELVTGHILNVEAYNAWEFNVTNPIRNVVLPYLIVGTPIWIHQFLSDLGIIQPLTFYTLVLLPRLIVCFISFLNDYCLYKICLLGGEEYRTRLIAFASSYVAIIYGCRTFTNALEMALVSVLLCIVSRCIHHSQKVLEEQNEIDEKYSAATEMKLKVELVRRRKRLPFHSFSHCFSIATLTIIGIFNRPTFIAFAFSPIFFWLLRGIHSKAVGLSFFHLRLICLFIASLPSLLIFIFVDSIYYGTLRSNDFAKNGLLLRQFVFTPFNFLLYNMNTSNLADHGLHPRLTHFVINIPLLYGVQGVMAIFSLLNMMKSIVLKKWHYLPRTDNVFGLMLASTLIPVGLLSMIPHQEPRFLLPITLPIIFLYSSCIQERRNVYLTDDSGRLRRFKNIKEKKTVRQYFRISWFVFNACFVLFYGFIHQAGFYPLLNHLSQEMKSKPRLTHIHLVTSYMYSLPISFLQIESSSKIHQLEDSKLRYVKTKDFYSYELGSTDLSLIPSLLQRILSTAELNKRRKHFNYKLFYVVPFSKLASIIDLLSSHNLTHREAMSTSLHLSTEAMPKFRIPRSYFSLFYFNDNVPRSNLDNQSSSSLSKNLSTLLWGQLKELLSAVTEFYDQFGLVLLQVLQHS